MSNQDIDHKLFELIDTEALAKASVEKAFQAYMKDPEDTVMIARFHVARKEYREAFNARKAYRRHPSKEELQAASEAWDNNLNNHHN